jgi:hypothetical protein
MALLFGFRHPVVIEDRVTLDGPRRMVSILAIVVFVLCFTPTPIEMGRP